MVGAVRRAAQEPAVLAMSLTGFDADTFGNRNFDKGLVHLQRRSPEPLLLAAEALSPTFECSR